MTKRVTSGGLYQDEVWATENGEVLISEMSRRHVVNVIKFLEERAKDIADADSYFWIMTPGPSGEMASLYFESDRDREEAEKAQDPVRWLRGTPLLRALWGRVSDSLSPGTADLAVCAFLGYPGDED